MGDRAVKRPVAYSIFIFSILLTTPPAIAGDCIKAQELTFEASRILSNNPALAEDMLAQAVGLCPKSASLKYNYAVIKMMRNKYGEAKEVLNATVNQNPDFADAHHALAQVALKEGDLEAALSHARKAAVLDPGNRTFQATVVAAMGVDTPPMTDMRQPDAVAVVIGNRTYRDKILSAAPVQYAINDARVMKEYLIQTLGFAEDNVIYMEDATLSDMVRVFGDSREFRGLLHARTRVWASTIFVFYSGHGAPDTNTKEAFIVPSDADPSMIRLTGYPLDTLNSNLNKIARDKKVKSLVVAMDACFSGGYNDGMLIEGASPIFIETDSSKLQGENAVVLSSSQKDQISSWYPDKKHGLFTYFLLKGIKDAVEKDVTLTAADLEKYFVEPGRIPDQAWKLYNRKQTPMVTGNKGVVLYRP
jgi:tetratricopeptide (TPR) repeat protein